MKARGGQWSKYKIKKDDKKRIIKKKEWKRLTGKRKRKKERSNLARKKQHKSTVESKYCHFRKQGKKDWSQQHTHPELGTKKKQKRIKIETKKNERI